MGLYYSMGIQQKAYYPTIWNVLLWCACLLCIDFILGNPFFTARACAHGYVSALQGMYNNNCSEGSILFP